MKETKNGMHKKFHPVTHVNNKHELGGLRDREREIAFDEKK